MIRALRRWRRRRQDRAWTAGLTSLGFRPVRVPGGAGWVKWHHPKLDVADVLKREAGR